MNFARIRSAKTPTRPVGGCTEGTRAKFPAIMSQLYRFIFSAPVREKPPKVYRNVVTSVCIFILFMELCERLCFYGLTGSLKAFLNKTLDYPNYQAIALTSVLPAFVYLTPLLGGFVADVWWGRFKTIFVFGLVYLLGTTMMAYSSYPGRVNKGLFMASLYGLIALGAGGIKSNVVTLGGDQFIEGNPEHKEQKESFFNYFYWAINIGAGFSYGYLAQMATNGSGSITKGYGFFWSFVICAIALSAAMFAFMAASGRYILKPPSGNSLAGFFGAYGRTLWNRSYQPWVIFLGFLSAFAGYSLSIASAFLNDNEELSKHLAISGCVTAFAGLLLVGAMCVDVAWVGDNEEDGILDNKDLWRILPPVLCATSFWVAYNQMATNFYAQSCQMDLRVGSGQLNASVLNIADCIAIVIFIPIFDSWFYPFVERVKGSRFTPMQKIATGFIVAAVALCSAAFIEIQRRKVSVLTDESVSNCAPTGTHMTNMSVFWMAIPYFLIGIGECFVSVQVYELCYNEVPDGMRSTAQAINLFTTGLASAISAGLTVAFQADVPRNLNNGHLERPYLVIAMLLVLTFFVFCFVVRNFEYKAQPGSRHASVEGLEEQKVNLVMDSKAVNVENDGKYAGDQVGAGPPVDDF